MIAGKMNDEILAMKQNMRTRWYKTILPEEKERAMKVVEIVRRSKIGKAMSGENNPNFGGLSEETKSKMSKSKMGKNNPNFGKFRPQHSERMKGKNNPNYGNSPSEEIKNKLRIAMTGENNHMYGNTHTEEIRIKQSMIMTERWKDSEYRNKMIGENASNWQNGISFEPYGLEFNGELKEQIRQRDGYICQKCGITQEECISKYDMVLSVHHIDYDKTNNKPDNLICLCPVCHGKTGFDRNNWTEYFRKIMEMRKKSDKM